MLLDILINALVAGASWTAGVYCSNPGEFSSASISKALMAAIFIVMYYALVAKQRISHTISYYYKNDTVAPGTRSTLPPRGAADA